MAEGLTVTWLGHSCFKAELRGYEVLFDPYENGYLPGLMLARQKADLVLCSHEHGDHNARSMADRREGFPCPFRVQVISTYHDDQKGALRGENRIHILEGGSFRIAHAGDLGCELLPEEKEALKGLDLLMVPVGGYYTIDARQAKKMVEDIKPRVVIPMHYRGEGFGFDVLAPLEDYTSLCDDVVDYDKNTLELAKDMPVQTAVLKLAKE